MAAAVFGCANFTDKTEELRAGPITYYVPKAYRAGGDKENNVSVQVAIPDWGPLERDRPGWQDNVNIFIGRERYPIAEQYDGMWDGTPIGKTTKWNQVERTYRIKPEFTVQEMGSGLDIIIPDQNYALMPLGLMQCTKPKPPTFPNAGCTLLFDRNGQRWQISFGRQFLHRYREFRKRATALFDSFREVPKNDDIN